MSAVDLVVRGDRVLIDGTFRPAALAIDAGRIAGIEARGAAIDAKRTIDAGALAVSPGFIDLHVHFDNPGESIARDFADGTANAALGGHTLVVDHPFSTPLTTTGERYRQKIGLAGDGARIDFGLWGAVNGPTLDEIPAQAQAGAAGFKAFLPENDMGYAAALPEHLRRGFALAARSGGTVLVHAEDRVRVAALAPDGTESGYGALARLREPDIEIGAVRDVLAVAEQTGGAVHFVHLSVPASVDLVTAARARGVRATCEAAAHHLLLDAGDLETKGWQALCAPPLRDRALVEGLWDRLRAGAIDAVVSDHCPYAPEHKKQADADPFGGPFGIQGVRESAPLFLSEALHRGWALESAIDLLTARPAALFRLGRDKGGIRVGADADLTLLDTDAAWRVDAEGQHGPWRWTPYEGAVSRVRVVSTLVRGELVVEEGALVGEPGAGLFVPMGGIG